jgi:hypothetical protein
MDELAHVIERVVEGRWAQTHKLISFAKIDHDSGVFQMPNDFVFESRGKGELRKFSMPIKAHNLCLAVAMSAMVQFRTLGGALGMAVVSAAFPASIRSTLAQKSFNSTDIDTLLQRFHSVQALPEDTAHLARTVFA